MYTNELSYLNVALTLDQQEMLSRTIRVRITFSLSVECVIPFEHFRLLKNICHQFHSGADHCCTCPSSKPKQHSRIRFEYDPIIADSQPKVELRPVVRSSKTQIALRNVSVALKAWRGSLALLLRSGTIRTTPTTVNWQLLRLTYGIGGLLTPPCRVRRGYGEAMALARKKNVHWCHMTPQSLHSTGYSTCSGLAASSMMACSQTTRRD